MDNARQHVAKVVQEKLLQYFNILYLSPYTPQFNVKLALFPLLILPDNWTVLQLVEETDIPKGLQEPKAAREGCYRLDQELPRPAVLQTAVQWIIEQNEGSDEAAGSLLRQQADIGGFTCPHF